MISATAATQAQPAIERFLWSILAKARVDANETRTLPFGI